MKPVYLHFEVGIGFEGFFLKKERLNDRFNKSVSRGEYANHQKLDRFEGA
jgi:hypothetical protein